MSNEYAFPHTIEHLHQPVTAGMTLRDYFAAKAMQGLIEHEERAKPLGSHNLGDFDVRVAVCAYRYADAMLKARGQG
jgi:hypothetical protein